MGHVSPEFPAHGREGPATFDYLKFPSQNSSCNRDRALGGIVDPGPPVALIIEEFPRKLAPCALVAPRRRAYIKCILRRRRLMPVSERDFSEGSFSLPSF